MLNFWCFCHLHQESSSFLLLLKSSLGLPGDRIMTVCFVYGPALNQPSRYRSVLEGKVLPRWRKRNLSGRSTVFLMTLESSWQNEILREIIIVLLICKSVKLFHHVEWWHLVLLAKISKKVWKSQRELKCFLWDGRDAVLNVID